MLKSSKIDLQSDYSRLKVSIKWKKSISSDFGYFKTILKDISVTKSRRVFKSFTRQSFYDLLSFKTSKDLNLRPVLICNMEMEMEFYGRIHLLIWYSLSLSID